MTVTNIKKIHVKSVKIKLFLSEKIQNKFVFGRRILPAIIFSISCIICFIIKMRGMVNTKNSKVYNFLKFFG